MSKKKKTYKKKYYTGGRVDMSKGGRVKARRGGLQNRRLGDGLGPLEPNENEPIATAGPAKPPVNNKRPISKPIAKKPPQALKRLPKNKVPPKQPPMSVGGVGGGKTLPAPILPGVNIKPELPSRGRGRIMTGREDEDKRNALQTATQDPKIKNPIFIQEPISKTAQTSTGGGRDRVGSEEVGRNITGREELGLSNKSISPTFQKAPITGKGSDQMFIDRERDVQPQSNFDVQDRPRERGYQPPYRPPGTPPYTPPGTPPVTPPTDGTITGTPEQLEAERGKRVIQTGRTAEQIAAGQIPEGTIPTAEVEQIMEGRPDETQEQYEARMASMEAEAVQIEPGAALEAEPVAAAPSE